MEWLAGAEGLEPPTCGFGVTSAPACTCEPACSIMFARVSSGFIQFPKSLVSLTYFHFRISLTEQRDAAASEAVVQFRCPEFPDSAVQHQGKEAK
ncbi:hypothetical protein [Sinorhizobium sojae]|uniref:hypothetical protein n=1 Tax=Sinorhizobium sojae TaxID=716925 RepID=UPI0012F94249|nr:hypothetical protein [Sinorhizobium sojae]